jgi:hypothetical protein
MIPPAQEQFESEFRKRLRGWLRDIAEHIPKTMTFQIILIGYSALIFRKKLTTEGATTDIDAFFDGKEGHEMFQEIVQALGFDDEFEILEYRFVEESLLRVPDYRSRMQHFMTVENIHVFTLADEDILILKLHANRRKDQIDLHFLFQKNPDVLEKVKQLLQIHQHEELLQRILDITAMKPSGAGRMPWK